MRTDFDASWPKLAEEVMSGMKEWRIGHPSATLREIEDALDERLGKMRARMLADAALASARADLTGGEKEERVVCPECGGEVEARGKRIRRLTSQANQVLNLARSYADCPQCEAGFFPSG